MEHMKQEKLFLIIGIIFLTLAPAGWARADGSDQAVAKATLTAYELGSTPADQPLESLPRWKSSLGEIQQAASTLLETNSKLNGEARQLNNDLQTVQAQIDQQRSKNAQISDEIVQLRGKAEENNDPDQISRFKEILADRNRQVQAQKDGLAALKARHGSLASRVSLARLHVAELEVDQKARDVDMKFRDDAAINALRAQVEATRDKIVKGEQQVKLLGEKAAELGQVDNTYATQTREITAKNTELRERLADLQAKNAAQQAQFEEVAAGKLKAEKGPNVLRVQKLLADRDALQARLKENSEKLEALKNSPDDQSSAIPAASAADVDKLQKQNAAMEEAIGDLRENVALLEYKVTTLQRYKDRNKAVPHK